MPSKQILPDKPSIVIDASTIDQMPPEVQEVLGQFYSEQERARAKAKDAEELAYQTEQANTLLSFEGWEEVDICSDEQSLVEEAALDDSIGLIDDPKAREAVDIERLSQKPTLHQFYRDLYGVGMGGEFLASYADYADTDGCTGVFYLDSDYAGQLGLGYSDASRRLPAPILVNHRDRKHPFQLYSDYFDFVEGVARETSFIHMGSFWVPPNGYLTARKNAMVTINGFCVDLDRSEDDKGEHFDAGWVMSSLNEFFERHTEVRPNYLMLSGTGIQLWYVFGRSIPLLSAKGRNGRMPSPRRGKYDDLLKRLYRFFKDELPPNRFKVDIACAAMNHAFRAPNSPSKHHYPTRLFVFGGRRRRFVDPLALSEFLDGDLRPYDVEDWNQEAYVRLKEDAKRRHDSWFVAPATDKQVAWLEKLEKMGCIEQGTPFSKLTKAEADVAIKTAEVVFTSRAHYAVTGGYVVLPNGFKKRLVPRAKGLYFNTLDRIEHETPTGSRYWSLFGLAGLGYNCNIPEHVVLDDMRRLKESDWGHRVSKDGKPVTDADIRSAMRGYNPIGAMRHRPILEDYLCWQYNPPPKRNGRTRKEHLWGDWFDEDGTPEVNTARENRRLAASAKKKRRAIDSLADYLTSSPNASKRECCRVLSMSASTVTKYWSQACEAAGVEDVRSGNHSPR